MKALKFIGYILFLPILFLIFGVMIMIIEFNDQQERETKMKQWFEEIGAVKNK